MVAEKALAARRISSSCVLFMYFIWTILKQHLRYVNSILIVGGTAGEYFKKLLDKYSNGYESGRLQTDNAFTFYNFCVKMHFHQLIQGIQGKWRGHTPIVLHRADFPLFK